MSRLARACHQRCSKPVHTVQRNANQGGKLVIRMDRNPHSNKSVDRKWNDVATMSYVIILYPTLIYPNLLSFPPLLSLIIVAPTIKSILLQRLSSIQLSDTTLNFIHLSPLHSLYLSSARFIFLHPILGYCTWFDFTVAYLILLYLTSSLVTPIHLISLYPITSHQIKSHLISSHLISSHLTSPYQLTCNSSPLATFSLRNK